MRRLLHDTMLKAGSIELDIPQVQPVNVEKYVDCGNGNY